MKLYEFFGNFNHNVNAENDNESATLTKEQEHELEDTVFWYILDNDDLHKKYFLPIAKELAKKYANTKDDASFDWKVWISMVHSGCMKYWKENKIQQHPKDTFGKEFRKNICKRLEDHYHNEIEEKDSHEIK